MTGSAPNGRWGRVLRYTFAGTLCMLMPVALRAGLQWYWAVSVFCGAAIIMVGQRRILRPGVSRTASEIVCHYIPRYEGNAYLFCLLLPLIGVAAVVAGRDPSNPTWLLLVGVILLSVTPLLLWSVVHVWHRSILRISPLALTLRSGTLGSNLTEIPREHVDSITPKIVPNPVSGQSLQVEIAYRSTDSSSDQTETVLLGMHLTVQPINLLNALAAWKDATNEDPDELLDRIEQILRGRSKVGG